MSNVNQAQTFPLRKPYSMWAFYPFMKLSSCTSSFLLIKSLYPQDPAQCVLAKVCTDCHLSLLIFAKKKKQILNLKIDIPLFFYSLFQEYMKQKQVRTRCHHNSNSSLWWLINSCSYESPLTGKQIYSKCSQTTTRL